MAVWEGCFVGEKMNIYLNVFAFGMVLAFEEVLPRVYTIPRVKNYRFNSKTQQPTVGHITAAILVPLQGLHTKLYKFGPKMSPNNSRMKNYTDLNLGKDLFYHMLDSILFSIQTSNTRG